MTSMPRGALAALLAGLLVGCSVTPSFPEWESGPFRPKPELGPQSGPQPHTPRDPRLPDQRGPDGGPPGPPRGCDDPDPLVIATCLEPISALVVVDGAALVGLAAERTTGRIVRVQHDRATQEIATLAVDTTTGGGLTGLALSPSYDEDNLIYAYITTEVDNRVVRIAPQDAPKPVLTGIPRGPSGNGGALAVDSEGQLLVATGDGGDPAAARDPASLAGKVLRLDITGTGQSGSGARGAPDVLASDLHAPGGLCVDPLSSEVWVTDRAPTTDLLYRLPPPDAAPPGTGSAAQAPVWTWPSRPGAAGCVVLQNRIQVAFTSGEPMFALGIGPDRTFLGQPREIPLDHYGQVSAAALSPEGLLVWLGTVNKAGGTPISSDERVFVLADPLGPGGGQD